eukprot:Skav218930  [mRNA]  locus=scaffold678:56812:60937:+ [translate_table: standard]
MAGCMFRSAQWWRHQAGFAALAAGTACGVALRPSKLSAADSKPQLDEKSAANLRPFHLATWQESQAGLVRERQVNKYLNPIGPAWPDFNFLNPDELVMGHIILNDSKQASRPKELAAGCVRGNACREIYWNPDEAHSC